MTLKQTERLLQLLAQYGVSHYKTAEVEVSIKDGQVTHGRVVKGNSPTHPPDPKPKQERPLGDLTPSSINIPHEVNKVASLLKLNDEDLVDALFPDHTQPPSED